MKWKMETQRTFSNDNYGISQMSLPMTQLMWFYSFMLFVCFIINVKTTKKAKFCIHQGVVLLIRLALQVRVL